MSAVPQHKINNDSSSY